MRSLRGRLIAVLLAVAAAGLILLAAITYAEQRSFQLDRVDQQLDASFPVLQSELGGGRFGGGRGFGFGPGSGDGDGGPPGGGRPRDDVSLPAGTYGERRDAGGSVVDDAVLTFGGETAPSPPALPAVLEPGRTITVDAEDGSLRYRAEAAALPFGGLVVAAVPLTEAEETLDRLLLVEALVILGVLALLGVVAAVVVRLALRPLDRMATTAGVIAGGDLGHRVDVATPKSEVGRLGLALNRMLDRLQEAFARRQESEDRLRRFLADASHELRTPLSSIRGYAELFRMGAASDPQDVAKAMRRIEEEAARMGVLVEDLLALARLDEQRDPLREPVDVVALARDAVDDARATAPDRAIALHGDGTAEVLADAGQLRQVLGNLVRNALVHTPPGTPVDVSVGRAGGEVVLEVRDHGPGLPPGVDAAALFERFWRAEGGRKQGKAGAGLGLAIVAAIVDAHGGTVAADDAPGGGARFTVRLPAGAPTA